MAGRVIPVEDAVELKRPIPLSPRLKWQPLVLLSSIVGLVCCSLELEVLEQIDSLSWYMTFREILGDASVALLILVGMTLLWWLCLVGLLGCAKLIPGMRWDATAFFWRIGLTIPLSYFVVDSVKTTRLRFFPQWHLGFPVWLWLGPLLVLLCAGAVFGVELSKLRRFCRTRLAPVGWLHFLLAFISIVGLWLQGVHVFRDFAHPARAGLISNQPDIYLITIDTLRADEMSLYGYRRPTTPHLDQFAQQASTFNFFFANSNFTTTTTTSIETGKLPWTHRVFQLGGFLRGQAQQESVATLLRQRGYYTAAVSSSFVASPVQHRTMNDYDAVAWVEPNGALGGFARDLNLVPLNTSYTLNGLLKSLTSLRVYLDTLILNEQYASPAEPVFDKVRRIVQQTGTSQPRFVWAHVLPPHDPYLTPAPYRGEFLASTKLIHNYDFLGLDNHSLPAHTSVDELRARYDENIAYTDSVVGSFLDWLDHTGRLERSVVIISSDHGESFEHGWFKHTGPYLYNDLIRIPLLIHVPGQHHGARISQPGEQVDLLPTILDLVATPVPAWAEGTSLVPALQGKALPQRLLFSMNLETNSSFQSITRGTVAVMDDDFKYIERLGTHDVSLYRYKTDPFETLNLLQSEPAVAGRMRDALAAKLTEINAPPTAKR